MNRKEIVSEALAFGLFMAAILTLVYLPEILK